MTGIKLRKIVLAAMFAALACVATMVIQVPSPTNGYLNFGDGIVLLSGWILGPVYGALAAGVGSMFADIFSGYMYYAPGTFVIKALVALTASLLMKSFKDSGSKKKLFTEIVSGIAGEAVMVLGYFLYAMLFLQKGIAAAASIPGNIVQGVFGIIVSVLVYELLAKAVNIDKLLSGGMRE